MTLFDKRYIDFNNVVDRTYTLFDGEKRPIQKYESIVKFGDDLFKVKKDGLYGLVDQNDAVVLSCDYEEISQFHEGMARIKKDGMYGFITEMFVDVIPCQYKQANHFRNGLARVSNEVGKTVFIDTNGMSRITVMKDFEYVSDLIGGLIGIKDDNFTSTFITDKNEPFEDGKCYFNVVTEGEYFIGEGDWGAEYKFNKNEKQHIFASREDSYDDWLRNN